MDNKNFENEILSDDEQFISDDMELLDDNIQQNLHENSAPTYNPRYIPKQPGTGNVINDIGAKTLNKFGVPKPIADKVIKKNGGTLSPLNLPANKILSNIANKSASTISGLSGRRGLPLPNSNNSTKNNSETQDENETKQKNNRDVKQKIAKKGLQALGIPSFLTNGINKSISESDGGKTNIDSIDINISLPIIGIGFIIISISIILFAVIAGVSFQEDESEVNSSNSVRGYITGNETDEALTQELVYLNVCEKNDDDTIEVEECLNSPAGQYFVHLRDLYNTYKEYVDRDGNPIELNIGLILETISYGISDLELFTEANLENIIAQADALAEAQVEHYQEIGDLYTSAGTVLNDKVLGENGEESYYRISTDKYNSYLLYGEVHENYQGDIKIYDVDVHPESDPDYIPEGRSYQTITEDSGSSTYTGNDKEGYIYLYINTQNNMSDDEIKANNNEVLKEIYERADENYNAGFSSGIVCPGIMVTGENEGVYSLEDYIAGVIHNENHWYQDDNIENMKAQAVAARTYALRLTANCTLPIENSASRQTFNPNPSEKAKQAALETANQVLLNQSGDYASAEYDAFAVKEITDDFYILKQANLQIPVDWVLANISSANLEYYETHNHGRGMSQWGSRYLQTQGYTYDKILSTFYTSDTLTTLGNSVTVDIPNSANDLRNRYYFNFDINAYRSGTGFGQCVWYAKHRAMEIISTSSLAESSKQLLINSINNTPGNGKDWFANPNATYFKKSTNINDAKAGSIVSWAWTQEKCVRFYGQVCDANHPNYGHVAIVESVFTNSNGETMVTLTEGWRAKNSSGQWYTTPDLWSVVKFSKKDLTLSQLKTYSGIFNGYVYLY